MFETTTTTTTTTSTTKATARQRVAFPLEGGLQGLRPGQDSTAFRRADHVDIPVPRSGGLQGSRPRQASTSASSSHSRCVADEAFTADFARFSKMKKCEVGSALGVGTECGLYSVHAVGSAGGFLH